jgi:hypothetical protein
MPSNEGLGGLSSRTAANPFKVLVIGGSYGGLGATLNLLDLCNGRQPRFAGDPPPLSGPGKIPVDITVVDEKDGYCEWTEAQKKKKGDEQTSEQASKPRASSQGLLVQTVADTL